MRNTMNFLFSILAVTIAVFLPTMSMAEEARGTRQSLKLVVNITAKGLGNILQGEKSHATHIKYVTNFIRENTFFPDESGYFFVYDTDGVCVAHATQPELIGKNLSALQDASGQYVIRNIISIAKQGGGFLEFGWNKPGSGIPHDKLGYVVPVPGTKLIIGSGIYFPNLN